MVELFITSLLGDLTMTREDGSSLGTLPRHAVWGALHGPKAEVMECSDDLAQLRKKWGVPAERCYTLGKP